MKIDLFASEVHYLRHMYPLWNRLPAEVRGEVMVFDTVRRAAAEMKMEVRAYAPNRLNAVLVAGFSDARMAKKHGKVVMMEHGVGQTYCDGGSYYAGGPNRDHVSMFLCPNFHVQTANRHAYPDTPAVVIGTPAMDYWHRMFDSSNLMDIQTDVAITFHWQPNAGCPEMGSALTHYARKLGDLARSLDGRLVGHSHPRIAPQASRIYNASGIPYKTLHDVFMYAGVLCADNTSALYEFASLGKPVVVMNAPYMRREVNHGLRFWEFADVGIQVEGPDDLELAIEMAMIDPPVFRMRREEITEWLYPYRGHAAQRGATVVTKFLGS